MTTSTFRQTVAAVAARAKAILPASTNGRVEAAVALVLAHDVLFLDSGAVEVGSASDPLKVHVLTGATCDCADFPRAPESWCKHRLAAGIMRRVRQEMAAHAPNGEPEPEVLLPQEMEPWSDNDPEPEEVAPPPPPTPAPTAPCPEACFSLTLKGTIDGHEALLTARGQTAAEFQANLAAVRGLLDQPTPPQAPSQPPAVPQEEQRWCPKHGEKMQLNHKEGRSCHSHKTADGHWCQAR